MTESQRGMVAARIATLSAHRPSGTASIEAVKQPDAAKMMNVSRSTVQKEGVPIGTASAGVSIETPAVTMPEAARMMNVSMVDFGAGR